MNVKLTMKAGNEGRHKRFVDIECSGQCYVNSLGQHYFHVKMVEWRNGKFCHRHTRYYAFAFGFEVKVPKYVEQAARRSILEQLEAGSMRFYEHDRDGNRRYENLRYHEERDVTWMIACFKKDLNIDS